ncbi:protein of unknown function [Streptomyces murinus]
MGRLHPVGRMPSDRPDSASRVGRVVPIGVGINRSGPGAIGAVRGPHRVNPSPVRPRTRR